MPLLTWIEEGHSSRLSGMFRSLAMVGSATVVKPFSSVEMPVIRVTDAMIMAVRDLEVTVSTLSS